MHPFLLSLLGGILIGLSASLLLLFNGRVAGISGIAGGLLSPSNGDVGWRVAFLGGLMLGGVLLVAFLPRAMGAPVISGVGLPVLAGLLVGVGTRLGGGCTSGHGVCGVARGAKRSLVATCVFVFAAMVTVFVTRHLMGGVS